MNLLFTSFNQEGKGSFLRAFALAKELVKRGHQLTVLCASTNSRFEEKHVDGVRLVCFPWGKRFLHGYNPCEVRVRKRWFSKQVFDVVHALGNFAGGFLILPMVKLLRKIDTNVYG